MGVEELSEGPRFGGRGRVVARAAGEALVVPPALGEVAVEVDAGLGVLAAAAVAVVVLVLDDDRPALLGRRVVGGDADHEPGIDVVDDEGALWVAPAELGDEAVAVEVVGAVLVDLAVAVVVAEHAVLALGDAALDAVEDAVRIDDGADVEGLAVDEGRDVLVRAVAGDELVDRVEADLGAGVLVAVGRAADPVAGLAHVRFHGFDVADALSARVAEPGVGVDGRARAHVRNDKDVDGPAHSAPADLDEGRDVGVGGGHVLEVFHGGRVAVIGVEGDGDFLRGAGRRGGRGEDEDESDDEGEGAGGQIWGHVPQVRVPKFTAGFHAIPPYSAGVGARAQGRA